jgi:hypothetical protein
MWYMHALSLDVKTKFVLYIVNNYNLYGKTLNLYIVNNYHLNEIIY